MYLVAKRKLLAPVLALALLSGFCNSDVSPASVIAGADTLINFLEKKGKITPETAVALKADFKAGAECATTLEDDLDQIPKDDPEERSKKLVAWSRAASCWSPIVLRQNFIKDPQVQNVANLISSLFAAGVAHFSDKNRAEAAGVARPDDAQFEREVERRLKEIKEAAKP